VVKQIRKMVPLGAGGSTVEIAEKTWEEISEVIEIFCSLIRMWISHVAVYFYQTHQAYKI
jgi:hypothetical protein